MSGFLGSWRDRHYLLPAVAAAGLALSAVTLAHAVAVDAIGPNHLATDSRALASGVDWTPHAVGPATAQAAAMRRLAVVLEGAGVAGLAVAALLLGGLYATRADACRSEWTIRRAVGASRGQLLGGGLVEGATVAAGAIALAVGFVAVAGASGVIPGFGHGGPLLVTPALVALEGALLALILLLSVAPFVTARRATNLAVPPIATRGIVVPGIQLGVTLAVLLSGMRLARSYDAMRPEPDRRSTPDGLVYGVSLPDTSLSHAGTVVLAPALEALGQDPAIGTASLTSRGMLIGFGVTDLAITDCGDCWLGGLPAPFHPVSATYHLVSADTFDAVGISVVAGRGVRGNDGPNVEPIAVVNQALARHHFDQHGALGRRIRVGRSPGRWHRVVGIVDDSVSRVMHRPEPVFTVYLSTLQYPAAELELMVTSTGDTLAAARAVEETIGSALASPLPVRLSALRQAIAHPLRRLARGARVVGALVLLLACYGVGVVVALSARRRRKEYALRRAVGARLGDVRRLAFGDLVRTIVLGLAIGWWLDLFGSGVLASVVGRDATIAPTVGVGLAGLLAFSALLSATIATWRSTAFAPARFLELAE